jgi:hypothetical protein
MTKRIYSAEINDDGDVWTVRQWACDGEDTARSHFARIGEPYGGTLRLIGPTGLVLATR